MLDVLDVLDVLDGGVDDPAAPAEQAVIEKAIRIADHRAITMVERGTATPVALVAYLHERRLCSDRRPYFRTRPVSLGQRQAPAALLPDWRGSVARPGRALPTPDAESATCDVGPGDQP